MTSFRHRRAGGYILLFSLVVSAVVMSVTVAFFNYFGSAVHAERFALASAQARLLAEAGIDQAVYELNQNANYSGESATSLGNGVFSISVASIDSNMKRVTVTASVPNSANPTATKVVQATIGINSSTVAFHYGVQIGVGGVTMNNGSQINGNLFSNGSISGGGTITGDVTVAAGTDPIPDQFSTVQNSGFNVGDTSARANVAQSFKPSIGASLAKISLQLKKVGNPNDITIKLVADNNGKPSKTVLASGTISASLITTVYGFADATLDSTPSLAEDQAYWLIAIASVNASNYFVWGLDSNSGYPRGAAKYSSNWNAASPSWSSITGDLGFNMYLSTVATSLSSVTVQGNAWATSLVSCTIGGNASYQTTSTCNVAGTSASGVQPATPVPFPISDAQITDWEATAAAGGTIPGPYSISGIQTLGPKKIDGDLTMSNGSTLILSGPLWINGDFILPNNSTISVSPNTGNSGAIIIADAPGNTATKGIVDLSNGIAINGNGNANSFPMILSTHAGSEAIGVANNSASVILYAPYGGVDVKNNASANQVTAKSLELKNNTSVNYASGLQSASFSNGSGSSWTVVPGTYAITQ